MVFVKDYVKEFYDAVRHKSVAVLVHMDVDALCACRMLQYLFRCDHVRNIIVPVTGKKDLEREFMELTAIEGDHNSKVDTFVLVNCGGGIDLVETLQPREDIKIFVCDSHRPVNVYNIYNAQQVRLLVAQEELDGIPEYEDLFREEDADPESDDDSEPGEKRAHHDDDYLERRRERRLWRARREKLLMTYNQFSSCGKSASQTIFELAWKLSLDNNDVLWLAIVGSASYFVHRKMDYEHYFQSTQDLQGHVARLNQWASSEEARKVMSIDCLRIEFDTELQLDLYHEWSLFESLRHSPSTACHFRIWTNKGMRRMQELLADMGLSLAQSRQKFSSMDVKLREGLKELVEEHMPKFGMEVRDVLMPAFRASYGYKNRLSSSEVVLACTAALEDVDATKSCGKRFWNALHILSRDKMSGYAHAVTLAQEQMEALLRQVRTFLDDGQVVSAGSYLYAVVKEGSPDAKYFANPICLHRLAVFTLEAFLATNRMKKAQTLPLVVATPLAAEKGACLVLGVPPLDVIKKDNGRNCFGEVFDQAVEKTHARRLHDSFDANVIELKNEDRSKFFDALINILEV